MTNADPLWTPLCPSRTHMALASKLSNTYEESVAACENRDIGPFRKGRKQITSILTFHF